ncbi:hypothetical protein OOT55_16355 [Marinimicrobium sp. C6131]|uniref:hypothetical protein n=1 Tax=Marinimicrobium sp. C6131 TaxID=3022676 RepID=UPI00223DB63D|nr:hypothetical protein [Marinimicrobium sp. C6131]UZJ44213.1 hypothetical protein OOT55_16355 [Marinimicrobium sp. C6131]
MKTCTVYGDMASEKSSEAYPTETFCDECYEEMNPGTEDSQVVLEQGYDRSLGEVCSLCGKSEEDEKKEQL